MSREVNEISSVPQTPRPNEINSHPAKTTILNEINSYPATPRPEARTPPVSTPPSQLHSPTFARSPLPQASAPRTPRTPRTPRFLRTPLGSPIRHAIVTMKGHLEELGHLTRFDPKDAWLPITESRSGNSYYAAFHTLSSGIGFQALVLPVAFTYLGWTWATIAFTVMFIWQLYTLWLLIQMHEAIPGIRYSRYMHLTESVFGPKLGKFLALIPILYLSAGISSALIIVGGSGMKQFFQLVCGNGCTSQPLTSIEWYLVFVCLATVLAQLPNLNSIAGVSLIGGTTAVLYCTLIWVLSVSKGQIAGVSYDLVPTSSTLDRVLDILNGLGLIAFAFRGHNLVLEIQSTLPSSLKHPSRVPMWKGVKVAYAIVACCLYPMAIGGFWAYGNKVPPSNGLLTALVEFHMMDIPRWLLCLTVFLVIMNCLASFQIYAMPIFDIMETGYVTKHNKPCPWWRRSANRILFSGIGFLIGVAFPFLPNLGALIGGIALPITLAYPSFMWISVTKPKQRNLSWYLNWVLGTIGMGLSVVLTIGALWSLIKQGVDLHFFQAA